MRPIPLIELAGPPGRVPTLATEVRSKLGDPKWSFADRDAEQAFADYENPRPLDAEPPRDETGS